MAVKKNQLYSTLWELCNQLRGGMDSSQYKDYILTLLFVKYISDKYGGDYDPITVLQGASFKDMLNFRGKKDIGEGISKILNKIVEANDLQGKIVIPHFDSDEKLGKGQEKVDKLTDLLNIFNDKMPDFKAVAYFPEIIEKKLIRFFRQDLANICIFELFNF